MTSNVGKVFDVVRGMFGHPVIISSAKQTDGTTNFIVKERLGNTIQTYRFTLTDSDMESHEKIATGIFDADETPDSAA